MTGNKIAELVKKLKKRRTELICSLCEDNSIFHPEVILRIVWELRGVVKTLKELEE